MSGNTICSKCGKHVSISAAYYEEGKPLCLDCSPRIGLGTGLGEAAASLCDAVRNLLPALAHDVYIDRETLLRVERLVEAVERNNPWLSTR